MNSEKIQIVYFSGTGGTERVASSIEQSFLNRNVTVNKTVLDRSIGINPVLDGTANRLILIFPVFATDAPEPVYEWLAGIPGGNGLPVAIISISGGGEVWPNTACRAGCVKLLEKKEYDVFYERMFIMPPNCLVKYPEQIALHLLKILPLKVEHCVSEILSDVRRRTKPGMASRVMNTLLQSEKQGAKTFGRNLQVRETCTGCGWCARNCPRKNIDMVGNRPSFGEQCVICLRCLYGCPTQSIFPGRYGFFVFKDGYDLNELEKRLHDQPEPVEKAAKGPIYAGVRRYLSNIEL